ncbi:hypothetical protein D3C81_627740 [compost metagenome]
MPILHAIINAARAQVGDHQRARIDRGQEQHETNHHRRTGDVRRCRQILQQLEQGHRRIMLGHFAQCCLAMVQHKIDGGVAEDRQPRQGEAERDQQHAHDHFTNGAATRDARHEQAHERCPGNPPRPVEQRPRAHPLTPLRVIEVHVEAFAHERAQIVAGVLHQAIEQVQGRPGHQHEQQQQAQQPHVEVGQPGDALLHTGNDADGGHDHHHQHDRHQHLRRIRDVEQVDQAGLHHQRTDAEVGDHRDQRRQDAEAIDHVTDAAMDALAEDRVQRRTQRQRQVAAIGEIAQRHADQRVQRPAVQAPVQEGQHHRFAAGRNGSAGLPGRVEEVVQRFVGTVVQQRDADAGREQH